MIGSLMRRQVLRIGLTLATLGGWWLAGADRAIATRIAQAVPTVAAASDLQFALDEIAAAFRRDHGAQLRVVYGSSGTLARQIRDGAPFELFLSADEGFVTRLADAGLTRDAGALYAVGRIVLFAPRGSPLDPRDGLDGLRRLLDNGGLTRFAIANPAHAPYGRAAEAALRAYGLWTRIQPSLVLGDTVSQAAQFATTGNAVGGIVAYSLALAPALRDRGTFALLPETLHPPLRQRMVLVRRAGPVAERLYAYLQESAARAIFQRYGFALPKERNASGHWQADSPAPSVRLDAVSPESSTQRPTPTEGCSAIALQTSAARQTMLEPGRPKPGAARREVTVRAAC
jgi:molybdate transport system substrate-binding protein